MIFKEQVEILKDLEHGIVMFNILSKKNTLAVIHDIYEHCKSIFHVKYEPL